MDMKVQHLDEENSKLQGKLRLLEEEMKLCKTELNEKTTSLECNKKRILEQADELGYVHVQINVLQDQIAK